MAVSQAHIRATRKYEAKNYDRVNVRLPKGTKDIIKSTSKSLNAYIVEAVKEKMERDDERG